MLPEADDADSGAGEPGFSWSDDRTDDGADEWSDEWSDGGPDKAADDAAAEPVSLRAAASALETAIGETQDQWEPDGDAGDEYAGTIAPPACQGIPRSSS